jgi:predicted negative regulator of RcsB-dependent stress response
MATFDLEQQEQLVAIKSVWDRWGNLVTWILIAVLGAYAAWNGWNYWQRRQGTLASTLYSEMERSADAGDVAHVERTFADMKDHYGRTTYATYAALLAAKTLYDKDKTAEAEAALVWAADKGANEGLRAIARLRLASVEIGQKAYDKALKTLSVDFPPQFQALAADRRGDVLLLQGKRKEAADEYSRAYRSMDPAAGEYRRLIGIKLNALGVDPDAGGKAGGAA